MSSEEVDEKMSKAEAFLELATEAITQGNSALTDALLLTYREFMGDKDMVALWNECLTRAAAQDKQDGKNETEKVINFMRAWVKGYYLDFSANARSSVLHAVGEMCSTQVANELKLLFFQGNTLKGLKNRSLVTSGSVATHQQQPQTPQQAHKVKSSFILDFTLTKANKKGSTSPADDNGTINNLKEKFARYSEPLKREDVLSIVSFSILNCRTLAIAYWLTKIEAELFRNITAREFLGQGWQNCDKEKLSPNITILINRINLTSFWVATEVLVHYDQKEQVQVVKKFIKVGKCMLKQFHNFNGVMEILSGLNFHFIRRLKSMWQQLPAKHLQDFEKLEEAMNPMTNFKNYRELYASINEEKSPKLPYFALVLRDFTFINEGNPKHKNDGRINIDRIQMLSNQVKEVKRIQSNCIYKETSGGKEKEKGQNEMLKGLLGKLDTCIMDEELLLRMSFKCQAPGPREAKRKRSTSDSTELEKLMDSFTPRSRGNSDATPEGESSGTGTAAGDRRSPSFSEELCNSDDSDSTSSASDVLVRCVSDVHVDSSDNLLAGGGGKGNDVPPIVPPTKSEGSLRGSGITKAKSTSLSVDTHTTTTKRRTKSFDKRGGTSLMNFFKERKNTKKGKKEAEKEEKGGGGGGGGGGAADKEGDDSLCVVKSFLEGKKSVSVIDKDVSFSKFMHMVGMSHKLENSEGQCCTFMYEFEGVRVEVADEEGFGEFIRRGATPRRSQAKSVYKIWLYAGVF